jgi:trigger factor
MDDDDKAKTEDQLRADYRAIADRRVRLGLLLGEIGRVNNIIVTPEEVNAAIRREAARYPGQEAQMIEFYRSYPAATDALRGPIFEDKVVDYVLDSATVTDAEISVEELEKDPEETKPAAPVETPAIEAAAESADAIEAAPERVPEPSGETAADGAISADGGEGEPSTA